MNEAKSVSHGPKSVEQWLVRHTWLAVIAVISAGLAIRIASICGTYLGSDEALHYQLVNVSSLADVYPATLTNAHPPLFFFLLYCWRLIGTSEFFLRLLPVLFGTAFLGVAYKWADHLFGKSSAFFTLTLLAFSPALISLSAEVRGYTLLLFLMASALLVLEQAIDSRSAVSMLGFSSLLYLTILTHYSAFWFAVAAFAYVVIRIRSERLPARLVATWLGLQAGAAALYAFLYFSHLVKLRGGALEQASRNRADLFYPPLDGVLTFLSRQTKALFTALLGSPGASVVGFWAGATGIALLALRRRPVALLLALPFLIGAAAGLAGFYPYGGTRHSSYLLLFAAGAIGVASAVVSGGRLWPAVLLGALLACTSLSHTPPRKRERAEMNAAIEAIRSNAPAGSLLFTDLHTGLILSYYLRGGDSYRENPGRSPFWRSSAGGYQLVGSYYWVFDSKRFSSELRRFVQTYQLRDQPVWIVHMGWEINPARALPERYRAAALLRKFRFGEISIVEVRLP